MNRFPLGLMLAILSVFSVGLGAATTLRGDIPGPGAAGLSDRACEWALVAPVEKAATMRARMDEIQQKMSELSSLLQDQMDWKSGDYLSYLEDREARTAEICRLIKDQLADFHIQSAIVTEYQGIGLKGCGVLIDEVSLDRRPLKVISKMRKKYSSNLMFYPFGAAKSEDTVGSTSSYFQRADNPFIALDPSFASFTLARSPEEFRQVLLHEIRHVHLRTMLLNKIDLPYYAEFIANRNSKISNLNGYEQFLSVEELTTYSHDMMIVKDEATIRQARKMAFAIQTAMKEAFRTYARHPEQILFDHNYEVSAIQAKVPMRGGTLQVFLVKLSSTVPRETALRALYSYMQKIQLAAKQLENKTTAMLRKYERTD
jgi:hypothetical protein